MALFMPPLCARLTAHTPNDRDLIPLLECLTMVRECGRACRVDKALCLQGLAEQCGNSVTCMWQKCDLHAAKV